MYALEEEPESRHRWRRLGLGALITAIVLASLAHGAQRYEPARRLLQQVVQLTVVTELPKREEPPPPRTEPPPPPRRVTPQESNTPAAARAKPAQPQPESAEPVVGLEEGSFGSGSGPSFQVGATQLGAPANVARAPVSAPAPAVPPRLVPAGLPERVERCRYHSRAQRLGLQGLMVIETDIDPNGQVTRTRLRKGLEAALDRECLEAVRSARFQPATLGGQRIASTRLLRLRFELER